MVFVPQPRPSKYRPTLIAPHASNLGRSKNRTFPQTYCLGDEEPNVDASINARCGSPAPCCSPLTDSSCSRIEVCPSQQDFRSTPWLQRAIHGNLIHTVNPFDFPGSRDDFQSKAPRHAIPLLSYVQPCLANARGMWPVAMLAAGLLVMELGVGEHDGSEASRDKVLRIDE